MVKRGHLRYVLLYTTYKMKTLNIWLKHKISFIQWDFTGNLMVFLNIYRSLPFSDGQIRTLRSSMQWFSFSILRFSLAVANFLLLSFFTGAIGIPSYCIFSNSSDHFFIFIFLRFGYIRYETECQITLR